MATAATTADYQSPLLAHHAAGDALSVLTRGLYTDQRLGIVVKGPVLPHPVVTSTTPSTSPTQVGIRDCLDTTQWLEYKATGGLENDKPGGRHLTTATVTLSGSSWKVTTLLVGGLNTC